MGRKKTNIVISNWKGIVTLRSKPAKVKQTPNTVEAGRLFGMASNCSGIIRKLLKSLLPEPANRAVMHRLQKAFYQWLKTGVLTDNNPIENIFFFNGLSLNEKSELSQWLKFSPAVSRLPGGQLSVTFPSFDPVLQVKAPEVTTAINFSIGVAGLQMDNPGIQTSWQQYLTIQHTPGILTPKQLILPVAAGAGKLLIVVLALQFVTPPAAQQIADRLPWKPAGIIGSFYN